VRFEARFGGNSPRIDGTSTEFEMTFVMSSDLDQRNSTFQHSKKRNVIYIGGESTRPCNDSRILLSAVCLAARLVSYLEININDCAHVIGGLDLRRQDAPSSGWWVVVVGRPHLATLRSCGPCT
jgi:hypothetical protein